MKKTKDKLLESYLNDPEALAFIQKNEREFPVHSYKTQSQKIEPKFLDAEIGSLGDFFENKLDVVKKEQHKQVFKLYLKGIQVQEIGKKLNIKNDTVSKIISDTKIKIIKSIFEHQTTELQKTKPVNKFKVLAEVEITFRSSTVKFYLADVYACIYPYTRTDFETNREYLRHKFDLLQPQLKEFNKNLLSNLVLSSKSKAKSQLLKKLGKVVWLNSDKKIVSKELDYFLTILPTLNFETIKFKYIQ